MYEQVFNLTSRPFTSTPYVKHYFPARAINGSLQQCQSIIDRGAGPVVVVGDHGTGKTLLLAMLADKYQSEYKVVNLSCSMMQSRMELLQTILFEVKQDYRSLSESEMRLGLIEFVKTNEASGAGILLLIDDAQKLTRDTIEELQLLTNFIRDGQPRVRLVIAGSQGLEDRLADSCLESFNQRVAGRCFLECLDRAEVESYVRAHIEKSGGSPDQIFEKEAYRAICDVSEGRPRFINQVCDHAMIFSATRGICPVTDSLVREAWMDVQQLPGSVGPSAASVSGTPSSTTSAPLIEESDGWTVLEFGELEEEVPVGAPEIENQVEEVATPIQEAVEHSNNGPRFTVTPVAPELVSGVEEQADEVFGGEEQVLEFEPTVENGAEILASAMSEFTAPSIEEEPVATTSQEEVLHESVLRHAVPVEVNYGSHEDAPTMEVVDEVEAVDDGVAADPFADDGFEDEEVLTDTYSPFVAQQNQRSLNVTTDQLRDLTPHDMEPVNLDSIYDDVEDTEDSLVVETSSSVAEESFPTFDTAMAAESPVREPVKRTYEQREELETRYERDATDEDSFDEEFSIKNDSAILDEGNAEGNASIDLTPIEFTSTESEIGSNFVPLDPEAAPIYEVVTDSLSFDVESTSIESIAEVPEQFTVSIEANAAMDAPVLEETTESSVEVGSVSEVVESAATEDDVPVEEAAPSIGLSAYLPPTAVPINADPTNDATANESFHEQTQAPNDPEISRMAADIIRSLNTESLETTNSVSHETGVASVQDETAAIENTIQKSLEQRGDYDEGSQSVPSVVMPQMPVQAVDSSSASHVPSVQPLGVHEANPSPSPIAQEAAILNEIRNQSAIVAEESAQFQANAETHDDRDILNVSANVDQVNQEPAAAEDEASLPAWSQNEPSTGEANRVDYQQLFNQLRNINPDE